MFGIDINFLALIISAVISMIIGALWYGPIFGKQWMVLVGKTEEQIANSGDLPKTYGIAFINAVVMSLVVGLGVSLAASYFFPNIPMTFLDAIFVGKGVGFGVWLVSATTSFTNKLFEGGNMKLWAIENGYWLFALTIAGLIFALWI